MTQEQREQLDEATESLVSTLEVQVADLNRKLSNAAELIGSIQFSANTWKIQPTPENLKTLYSRIGVRW